MINEGGKQILESEHEEGEKAAGDIIDKNASIEEKQAARIEASSPAHRSSATVASRSHPSRNLGPRSKGYGIGGGYERPYRREKPGQADSRKGLYGPLPHAGYYGAGLARRPFKMGQASFCDEMEWYRNQYGERTSGFEEGKPSS
jgi:hypothetical protein